MLAEIETDKATMEFESFNAGTLLFIGIQEGESAPVDSVLAIIGPAGTDITGIAENYSKGGEAPAVAKTETAAPVTTSQPTQETTTSDNGRVFASPLAKQIAKEKGINLSQVKGSGENGRIVKSDVENFTASAPDATTTQTVIPSAVEGTQAVSTPTAKPFVPAGEVVTEEIKNSQMRKIIAKRLAESLYSLRHTTI